VLAGDPKHAAIIYYRTPSFETRLSLVEELLLTVLPQRQRKRGDHDHADVIAWTKLLKDTRELLPIRNLLAHSPISIVIHTDIQLDKNGQASKVLGQKQWHRVQTSPNEMQRGRKEAERSITDDQLPHHYADVSAIGDRFMNFANHVKATYARTEPHELSTPHKSQP